MKQGAKIFAAATLVLCAPGALAGCEDTLGAPPRATWVDDVEPILRANCFHCHGSSADFMRVGTKRWDFLFDEKDPQLSAIGDFKEVFGGTGGSAPNDLIQFGWISAFVVAPDPLGRMPPPPATALSARDIKALDNWKTNNFARGMRLANAKPTAAWLKTGTTFVVSDADREQVLGKVSCGGREALLIRSGTHSVPEGAGPPCTVTLYDGQETNTVTLD